MTDTERYSSTTPFKIVYEAFLYMIKDIKYALWTEAETHADLQQNLIYAIPKFRYPRFKPRDINKTIDIVENSVVVSKGQFNFKLTDEEINILATIMKERWLSEQIYNYDLIAMKYSSSDFRVSSQANHLKELKSLKDMTVAEIKSLLSDYSRKIENDDGTISPNFGSLSGGTL